MIDSNDEDLMLRYCSGQSDAFEALYMKYKAPLYSFMLRQSPSRAICDELYQDVWMGLIRARQEYKVTGSFKSYLYQIARNRIIDFYRVNNLSLTAEKTDMDTLPDDRQNEVGKRIDDEKNLERLQVLIKNLPQNQREVFLLKEHAGLSLQEIASITAENIETVKSRLRYAFNKLRSGMDYE